MAILVLVSLVNLSLLFSLKHNWRESAIFSAVIWGVFITATTEVLSLFQSLSFIPLIFCWVGFNLIVLSLYIFQPNKLIKQLRLSFRKSQLVNQLKNHWFLAFLIQVIGLIAIIICIIALVAPPNTWDSMTYHMSRVVNWIQNGSVAHYTTYNLPQLFHPPFAEYAITHLQILSGGDRYANLVQWLSFVGSAIAVSLIAKELGANSRGQVFAAVFATTIPMGILQASSTQNDYVISFWILCLAYYIILEVTNKKNTNSYFFIGASLGLAILTKSSGYIYAFSFMVWFSLFQLKRWGWRGFKFIFITTSIGLIININHYLRNYNLFGTLLGTPDNFAVQYKIEVISLPTFISNLLRNLALHADIVRNLGLQNFVTPITGIVNKLLLIIHQLLGVDMYDPRITANSYSGVPGLSFNENTANNPLHFLIILLMIIYFLLHNKLRKEQLLIFYIISSIGGFLLLCLLLKIQGYHTRHHLAAFLLLAPLVGICLSNVYLKKVANTLVIILLLTSLPWVFKNQFRPLMAQNNIFNLERTEQYFINRPHLQKPYETAVNFVVQQKCDQVGLSLGEGISVGNEYWEYPLWVLFQMQNFPPTLKHIEPQNISQTIVNKSTDQDFNPCAIIAMRVGKESLVSEIKFKDRVYKEKWHQESVNVLLPK